MLNDLLFLKLRHVFRNRVTVRNHGAPMRFGTPTILNGRQVSQLADAGEEYLVDCLFCHDSRQRLYIGHGYGRADPISGFPMKFLTHCFNEGCTDAGHPRGAENREKLWDLIGIFNSRGAAQPINWIPGLTVAQRLVERPLPGTCVPLTSLPIDAPAVRYLVGERRFDYATAERFNLQFCVECSDPRAAAGRIVAPIVQDGIQVGWQARSIDDRPGQFAPKYFTSPGLPKRLVLYNLDQAAQGAFGVLMEGTFDCWRMPDHSLGLLGKTISLEQAALLQRVFSRGQPIGVCLDSETYDNSARRIHELIQAGSNQIFRVRLPKNTDPADLDGDTLQATIFAAAAAAGVRLPI